MNTIIFDLDGTLADTSADLISAANNVLNERGCGEPLNVDGDKLLAFKGGRALLAEGFKRVKKEIDDQWFTTEGYPSFLRIYEVNLSVHTTLFPDVTSTLDALINGGWRLGVCTNKPERLARLLLTDLGVIDRFGSLIGADTLPTRKPHPEPLLKAISEVGGCPEQSILVGDTDTDVNTARAANVAVVAMALDEEQEGLSLSLGADALLTSYNELPRLAAKLCQRVCA